MAVLIVMELLTLWFSIHTLSSIRALIGAESLWSKAQKDAIYQLGKYHRTHDEADYLAFQKFMEVPMGDHITRMELFKEKMNMDTARKGFIQGRVHPDDIDGMIRLLRRFNKISYIKNAIVYWSEGDDVIQQLIPISVKLHQEINSPAPSQEKLEALMSELDPINLHLTKLEDNFSYTLEEGSRWMENLILKVLFAVALTVEITGLVLTISVSNSMSKALNEINRATRKIAKGDLEERATVYSMDEIGQVATAVNQMTEQLVLSNKELGQFAYIASHDLQEPLRTISNYVSLFQKKYEGKLDTDGDKYLNSVTAATVRMQDLIRDVLEYSRIGHDKTLTNIDCNLLVQAVLTDLSVSIKESNALIHIDDLPAIDGYYADLRSLFQNLISNAIKYRKADTRIKITISAQPNTDVWQFSIMDNGIGIEEIYYEKIFIIFQKLHGKGEFAGTGIGLAQCKKIVEMHGGKIWVDSEIGKGSTFYFTILKNIFI
ncbi:MAG: ATP-binding protein [Chitinophagales bacterium]